MEWTEEADVRLRQYLARPGSVIPSGLGTDENACSIAAINLALNGQLTDGIPDCMSVVIGNWIRCIQDAMPFEMRNSPEWRELLPLAAGTGQSHERKRIDIVLSWMFDEVLPLLQPLANDEGYGPEWRAMCTERTETAADIASARASFVTDADSPAAAAAEEASGAIDDFTRGDGDLLAGSAGCAAIAVAEVAECTDELAWRNINPIGLLRRLIEVSNQGGRSGME